MLVRVFACDICATASCISLPEISRTCSVCWRVVRSLPVQALMMGHFIEHILYWVYDSFKRRRSGEAAATSGSVRSSLSVVRSVGRLT